MTEHNKVAVRRESKKRSTRPPEASEAPVPSAPPEEPLRAPEPRGDSPSEPVEDAPPRPGRTAGARTPASSYTVMARRYRPQRFEDVVGQDHVVQSLKNAIRLSRIAQAYLFCGTRGVGKTSMARIFAKCLNCVRGPTDSPCQTCDMCQGITVGQDVDVIEIDGASNNGVEQVRELRQHASLRPSRSRYKIYYIDEVHMLSTGAFNALLKTLEEPPPHVKFLFATTEPNKIPITVLSRCQRYDFAGITPEAIAGTLGEICKREGVEYEPEGLQIVARRAGGSLRDAQSLLDRLLASGSPELTVEVVHALLGTATDERLLKMLEALADHDSAAALGLLEQSAGEGVQPADLLGGLIDLIRDAMILAAGAESMLLAISPRNRNQLKSIVDRWGLQPIMASLQILAESRARMRGSVHGRLLLETALVRVARLEELSNLSSLVERLAALESGATPRRPDPSTARATPRAALAAAHTEAPAPATPAPAEVRPRAPIAETMLAPEEQRLSPVEVASAPVRAVARSKVSVAPESPSVTDVRGKELGPVLPPAGHEGARAAATADPGRLGAATAVLEVPKLAPAAAPEANSPAASHHADSPPLDLDAVRKLWPDLIKKVGTSLGWKLSQVEPVELEGPDVLVIAAKPGYNSAYDECGTPEAQTKIGQALQRLVRRPVKIKYIRRARQDQGEAESRQNEAQRANSLLKDPMVQRVLELFEARPVQMDYDEDDPSPEN